MDKKNKKTTSSTQIQNEKSVGSGATFQVVLENSLSAIDGLIEGGEYVYALDRICLDLEHVATKEQAITQYELRLINAIGGLCTQSKISVDPAEFGSLRSIAPPPIVQLVSSTSIRASLACAAFPVSSYLKREFASAIDQSFSDLGRKQQHDPKTQAYEKRKILVDALETLEADMQSLLRSDLRVDLVGALRQSFMKLFKTPMTQAVIWPFIPKEMRSEVRLAQLFQCVSALAEAGPEDLLQVFKNASEILKTFTAEAEQLRTHYSQEIFAKLGRLLTGVLEGYMAASPLAQPARIDIVEIKKKYPLSMAGTTLFMTFQVKNYGPGPAQDVLFRVDEIGAATLSAEKKEWYLGTVAETAVDICVPIIVKGSTKETAISTSVAWKNFDNGEVVSDFVFDLHQQRTDVDWEIKKFMDPYSLEPVEDESELIGRADVLGELSSLAYAKSVGSCYLYGQKRVGKTSVVKTLRNKLQNQRASSPVVIYLERGEFAGTDPIATIVNLGQKLCQQLKECDSRFNYIESPAFKDTLVPLNTFLEDIGRIAPQFRALFILDEFDELPINLYKRTPIGDAFFGSLRSLTSKPSFGLILVGSENMRHVIHLQGHALNKFQTIELDYFERQRHWADFQELVRRPVQDVLDVEDDAIVVLYEATFGNPFFTKLICGRLFKTMVNRRDCHVTRIEMHEAINAALRQDMGINKVQHFWSDGIFELEAKHESISLRRRKILLSIAFAARESLPIKRTTVIAICMEKFGLDETVVDQELADLATTRKIVRNVGGTIEFMVPFFLQWLINNGINEIIAVSIDADASLRRSREEEEARIRPEEILEVTEKWQAHYKGRKISEDIIRAWLNQFGDATRQRLAFTILQGLKFYTAMEIRAKVKEAHGIVTRDLVHVIEKGKIKRNDVLVSYLDGPGKSGARYAKLYADENNIYVTNVIERSMLGAHLQKNPMETKAVVFVDDLIGTGKSAAENFEQLANDPDIIASRDQVKLFFIAICGLGDGITELCHRISKLPLQLQVHVCDHIDDRDKVFSDQSRFFRDPAARVEALALCREIGSTLEKRQPLGYGDTQLAVVFEDTIPNNSLPVLWKQRKEWKALFPRD